MLRKRLLLLMLLALLAMPAGVQAGGDTEPVIRPRGTRDGVVGLTIGAAVKAPVVTPAVVAPTPVVEPTWWGALLGSLSELIRATPAPVSKIYRAPMR